MKVIFLKNTDLFKLELEVNDELERKGNSVINVELVIGSTPNTYGTQTPEYAAIIKCSK